MQQNLIQALAMRCSNSRFYDSSRGQFLSEDPVFWEIGQTKDGKAVLTSPQAQNSYSYVNGNPVVNKDPTGRCLEDLCVGETAVITSPMWVPAVAATAVGPYAAGMTLLRNAGGKMRVEPFDPSRLVRLPDPPSPFDFGPPNLPLNLSKWMRWAVAGTLLIGEITDEYSKFQDAKNDILNFVASSNPNQPSNANQTTKTQKVVPSQVQSNSQINTSQGTSRVQTVLSQLSSTLMQLKGSIIRR